MCESGIESGYPLLVEKMVFDSCHVILVKSFGSLGALCTLNTCPESSALLGHSVLANLKISQMNKVVGDLCHYSLLVSLFFCKGKFSR